MPRRKKRGPSQSGKESSDQQRSDAQENAARQLPPPRPPKKNLPLLIVCALLLAGVVGFARPAGCDVVTRPGRGCSRLPDARFPSSDRMYLFSQHLLEVDRATTENRHETRIVSCGF